MTPPGERIAKKQAVTGSELVQDLNWDEARDRVVREVIDEVILGNDEVLAPPIPVRRAVDRTLNLDDQRSL